MKEREKISSNIYRNGFSDVFHKSKSWPTPISCFIQKNFLFVGLDFLFRIPESLHIIQSQSACRPIECVCHVKYIGGKIFLSLVSPFYRKSSSSSPASFFTSPPSPQRRFTWKIKKPINWSLTDQSIVIIAPYLHQHCDVPLVQTADFVELLNSLGESVRVPVLQTMKIPNIVPI